MTTVATAPFTIMRTPKVERAPESKILSNVFLGFFDV